MPFSHSQRSRSKPCGLAWPCGLRSRTVKRQRSPALQRGASAASPRWYQPSCSKGGRRTGWPWWRADSTWNSKRTLSGLRCGSAAMRPVSSMSKPCRAGSSAFDAKCAARTPVSPAPTSAPAATASVRAIAARFQRSPTAASARPSANTPAYQASGHNAACCSCKATPSTQPGTQASARRDRVMRARPTRTRRRCHQAVARLLLAWQPTAQSAMVPADPLLYRSLLKDPRAWPSTLP